MEGKQTSLYPITRLCSHRVLPIHPTAAYLQVPSTTEPEFVDLDACHAREVSDGPVGNTRPLSLGKSSERAYSYSTQLMVARTHATLYLYVEQNVGTTAHNQSVLIRSGRKIDRLSTDSKLECLHVMLPRLDWAPSSWSSPIGTYLVSCIMNCISQGSRRVQHLSVCHRLGYKKRKAETEANFMDS